MKKIKLTLTILAILFLNTNICQSTVPKNQLNDFKITAQKVLYRMNNEKLTYNNKTFRQFVIDMYNKDYLLYKKFLQNKNDMARNYKYSEKMMNDTSTLSAFEEDVFNVLEPLFRKYKFILDNPKIAQENTFEHLYTYYFKKYNIKGHEEFSEFFKILNKYQSKIMEYRIEITKYSEEYEKKKAQDFYDNKILPYIEENKPLDLSESLKFKHELKTNKLYFSQIKVLQKLQGGFLAKAIYNNKKAGVIYISAQSDEYLKHNDTTFPCLLLKFTDRYYTYWGIYGINKKFPIFTIKLPAEISKNIPEIEEKFYFIEKPKWEEDFLNGGRCGT